MLVLIVLFKGRLSSHLPNSPPRLVALPLVLLRRIALVMMVMLSAFQLGGLALDARIQHLKLLNIPL